MVEYAGSHGGDAVGDNDGFQGVTMDECDPSDLLQTVRQGNIAQRFAGAEGFLTDTGDTCGNDDLRQRPAVGEAIAADTGSAIKGNKIDLCFDLSNSQIRKQFGKKTVTVYILD